jgi:hypothetical protein
MADLHCMNFALTKAAALSSALATVAWAQPAYHVQVLAKPDIAGIDVNAAAWQYVGVTAAGDVVMNVQWSVNMAWNSRAVRTNTNTATILRGERDGITVARALRDDGYVFGLDLSSSLDWPRQETAWRDGQRLPTDAVTGVQGFEVWGGAGTRLFGVQSSDASVLQSGVLTPVTSSFSIGGSGPYITAMNARGDFAGVDFVDNDSRLAVWQNGIQRLLPMPDNYAGTFLQDVSIGAINNNGIAVGTVAYSLNGVATGGTMLWHGAGYTMIGDVYHGNQPATLSDTGSVVTRDLLGSLLWIDGVTYRPSDVATPGFAGTLTSIDRIELDGRVLGQATINGERVPVLMTLIPSPASSVMVFASAAWFMPRTRRR